MKPKLHSAFCLLPSAFLLLCLAAPPALAQSGWGSALQFDGVDDCVLVPGSPALQLTNRFTLEFWFKPASLSQSQKYLLSHNDSIGTYQSAVIFGYSAPNQVEFAAAGFSGDGPRPGSAITLPDTGWHHIAYSYDGTTWAGYLDGVQEFSTTRNFALNPAPSCDWFIGAANATQAKVAGMFDEVRMWNVGRSAADIQANMLQHLTGAEAGLVAYWRFDEGTGTTTADATGHGHTGTLVNGPTWVTSGLLDPFITAQPTNQVRLLGATASFSVTAIGTAPLSYQWRKNGGNLADGGNVSGATTATLTLSSVLGNDTGSYDVVVSSPNGSATSTAAALVVDPSITAQPTSLSRNAGATATFSVTAIGTAPLSYQWRKNGGNLGDGGNVSGATTATLTLSGVLGADAGSYDVVLSNLNGTATSIAATLTVVDPFITAQPASQSRNWTDSATFSVTAVGTAPLSYQWRKDGLNLADGGNVSGATTATLTLGSVSASDAGSYCVVVTSPYGTATSTPAGLTLVDPAITAQPASQVRRLGEMATFSVTAIGTAPLGYQWRKNGVNLSDSGNVSGSTTATLTLGSVSSGDAGSYDIVVSNPNSTATSTAATLVVFDPSQTFQRLKSLGIADQSGKESHAKLVQGADGALYGTTRYGGSANVGTVFKVNPNGTGYTVLHSFTGTAGDGSGPYAGLILANDGALYGTTSSGGSAGAGTIFKLNPDGTGYTVLKNFYDVSNDGYRPYAALVQGSDGALYGTTQGGGGNNWYGTVFKLNPDGTGYTVLHNFTGGSGDGRSPQAGLVQGRDGSLYGTTSYGGSSDYGTVFKLNPDGTGYALLHTFGSATGDGQYPYAGLVLASNGALYGTTYYGGSNSYYGTIFKLNPDGAGYTVIWNFSGSYPDYQLGYRPQAALMQGSDGALYGTTYDGGNGDYGTVFKVNLDGSGATVLKSFGDTPNDGHNSYAALMQASGGALYGTTSSGGADGAGTIFKLNPDGSGYTIVKPFLPAGGDARMPYYGSLVQSPGGALYGTTSGGGSSGGGTVFKLNPDGTGYTLLHSFGSTAADGQQPYAGLVLASNGALYGTTSQGGSGGGGTIFKLNPDGTGYSVIRNFSGSWPDYQLGYQPLAALIQGSDGALYGTTAGGGSHYEGTVFKIDLNGSGYTVLKNFYDIPNDGYNPSYGALVQGSDGALYGTTMYGGNQYDGTVFKLNPDGSGYALLHNFSGSGGDGQYPRAGLVFASDGGLYGTTYYGGSNSYYGTIFKLKTDGSGYSVLMSFGSSGAGGSQPQAALVQRSDGALYGTTPSSVFRINTDGSAYTTLKSLSGSDGNTLVSSVLPGSDGALYGTAEAGGDMDCGTVFRITGFDPLITVQPTSLIRKPGESATFSVTATGTPPLSYQWRKNGANLGDGGNVSGAATATVTLSSVLAGDAGSYDVVVTSPYGHATSTAATLTVTPWGSALSFDGVDDYVSVAPNSALDLTTGTIEFWVNPGALVGNACILGDRGYTYAQTRFSVHMSTTAIGLFNGSTYQTVPFTTAAGQWYHVALVCSAGNTEVFVDGVSRGFTGNAFNPGVSGQGFRIGATYDNSGTGTLMEPFIGQLDEIRIWNVARSAADIQANLFQHLTGAEAGLVASWRFDEAAGTSTADATGHGNAGTLVNGPVWVASDIPDPLIAVQPTSQSRNYGDNAACSFSVTAIGTTPLSYQWRKSGVNLADGGNVAGATTATLTLSSLSSGDAGTYDVVVSNPNGTATSTAALLTVNLALADAFNPGANSSVYAMAVQADGKILVGGDFSTLAGQSCNYVGRLNADGTLDTSFNPGASSSVYSLAVQGDGKILVGGWFYSLGGQNRSCLGRLNADGTVDASFNPGPNSGVYCLAVQADGKILAGGYFTTLGGQSHNSIGRLNADGTVDTSFTDPGVPAWNPVYSLEVQADGKILVGGYFQTLGGQSHNSLARLNADGTVDTSFPDPNPGAWNPVYSLAVQADGKILVGGSFTTLGGQSRSGFGRLNADGTLDTSFNPGVNSAVYSTVVQADGKILASGYFSTLGGQSPAYLGRFNADGTVDPSFNPGANNYVYSLAVQANGMILVGGNFNTLAGQSRSYVGRLDTGEPATQSLTFDGTTLTWLRGGSGPEVWRTTFESWTGGAWTSLGAGTRSAGGWQLTGVSLPANPTVRARGYTSGGQYNASAGLVETMMGPPVITAQPAGQSRGPGDAAAFSVTAMGTAPLSYQWRKNGVNLADGGNVSGSTTATLTLSGLLAGDAGSYDVVVSNPNGVATSTAAVLSIIVVVADGFNPGANGTVFAMAVQADGKILVGGGFTTLGGQSCNYLGRLNADGTLDGSFNPGASSTVYSLAVQGDGKILVGGQFYTLGGQSRNYIGRLNADGTVDPSFNPGANYTVYSLAVQADGKILVGGYFQTLGGQSHNSLARLNADGTVDTSFTDPNPGAWNPVYSLAVQGDGKILVGGSFSTLGGQSRSGFGRLNADGTLDTSFNPGVNSAVYSTVVQADGKILAGGYFSTLGGQSPAYLGRFNADGTLDTSFNPGANNYVYSLAVQANGMILVGGNFTTLAGQSRSSIGRLNADGSLDTGFHPAADNTVYSLGVQVDGKILVGGNFTTLAGQSRSYLGRLDTGEPATQSLSFDGATLTWLRGGSGPEVWRTTFEYWTGTAWGLGAGTRTVGGWQLTGVSLPANPTVRARGYTSGGQYNASGGLVETVMGPLVITAQPASQSRNYGDTSAYSFSVTAIGTAPLSYQWRKAGVTLSNGGNVSGATTGTLTLSSVSAGDAGTYDVVVTNPNGSATSTAATLTVIDPVITAQPASQIRGAGDSATFSVTAIGTAPLSYQWRKNGLNLADSGNVSGANTATLILSNVREGDAGSYDVVVTNPNGSATSMAATLTVIDPLITTQPASLYLNAGDSATFSATAVGTAPLIYQWRLNGVSLADGGNVSGSATATLTLSSVLGSDAGSYDVVVSNPNGSATSTAATLTVVDPVVTAQPTSQMRRPGDTATFSVTAIGTAPLSYQWRKNGLNLGDGGNISGSTTATLTLSGVSAGDAGTYDVVVSNPNGTATSAAVPLAVSVALADEFNPGADSYVYSLAVQADGKILVGGSFSVLGGQSCSYLGRLNADGSVDTSFDPGANSVVYSMAVQADGKIVVGGAFTSLGGGTRYRIGRLNADGSLDASFNPPNGANSTVYSLAVQADGKIVVGGAFTSLGGGTRYRIGRLNADGSLDTFNPGTRPTSGTYYVNSLAVQADGKILVGGSFTNLASVRRNRIGRLNPDGSLDTGFNPGAGPTAGSPAYYVYSLAVQADGNILAGGTFTTLGGTSRSRIGRLYANGTLDTGFNPGASGPVYSLAVQSVGKILVGGSFTTLAGQSRGCVGRLNADGSLDTSFNPGVDYQVYSLAVQADGKILVGGYFWTLGGQSRTCLGRLDTGEPATQSLSFDGTTLTWLRGGSGPVVWRTTFDYWTGDAWTSLGAGTRIVGGWQWTGVSLPANPSIRARGYTTGGYCSASGGLVETMMGPPVITAQPANQDLNAGDSPTFSVTAFGTTPLSYQWRKDGGNLSDGGSVSGATTATLTLSSVLGGDAGSYDVVVSNPNGSAISTAATLTVVDPVIRIQPASQDLNAGDSATFSVTAFGTTPLNYQWLKDGGNLSDGGNISGATTATLTLTSVLARDAGSYDVVVTSPYGTATSMAAGLTVVDPAITAQPASQVRRPGDSATFSVTAIGTEPLGYQWRKDGLNLADGGNISGATTATLTLSSLREADTGSYDVVVSNPNGTATSAVAALTVANPLPPDSVSGLTLWLRSDVGVTTDGNGNVQTWADQSGNHYDASQETDSARPALVPGGFTIGSRTSPAIRFDGLDDYLARNSGIGLDGKDSATIFILFREVGLAGNAGIFGLRSLDCVDYGAPDALDFEQSAPVGIAVNYAFGGSCAQWANDPLSLGYQAGSSVPSGPLQFTLVKDATTGTLRFNGVSVGTDAYDVSNITSSTINTAGYLISARGDYGGQLAGPFGQNDFAEIIVYNRALSPAEIAGIEAYLVNGNQPPVAKCKDVTVSAGADCLADAAIDDGSSDPDAGDTITLTQSPAGPYPLGATSVTLTVTDNHGASAACTATVTVVDTTPPSITCPANITVNATLGLCTSNVTFTVAAMDNCGSTSVVSVPASGYAFSLGTTTVTSTADDGHGNTSQCSFTVTVADNEPPMITCPANITVDAAAEGCTSNVTFSVTATDNCGLASVSNVPASGFAFPVGTTIVNSTADDGHGNTSQCSFTVTVVDHEPPMITCPANLTVDAAPGECASNVTFTVTASDNCGSVTVSNVPASGFAFPVGTTTVTCMADDAQGNTSQCSFSVTVLDITPPSVTAGAIAACYTTQAAAEAAAKAATTVHDLCDANPSVTATTAGSCTATITVTATDASGNHASVQYHTQLISPPAFGTITATQNAANVKDCAATTVQGTVSISVQASDACGLLEQPGISLVNGLVTETAAFDGENPAGTFNYHWQVTAATSNGTWTATITASDNCQSASAQFNLCLNVGQLTGQVQLEGFVGTATVPLHTRTVVFVATDRPGTNATVLRTWILPQSNLSGGTFAYLLSDVPPGIHYLSAKTECTLRSKVPVTLDSNGQASAVNFTGSKRLRGGDFHGRNTVDFFDYATLCLNFFTYTSVADITGDNAVDFDDYVILAENWFTEGDPE